MHSRVHDHTALCNFEDTSSSITLNFLNNDANISISCWTSEIITESDPLGKCLEKPTIGFAVNISAMVLPHVLLAMLGKIFLASNHLSDKLKPCLTLMNTLQQWDHVVCSPSCWCHMPVELCVYQWPILYSLQSLLPCYCVAEFCSLNVYLFKSYIFLIRCKNTRK